MFTGNEACKGERLFPVPNLGVPNAMIDRFVDTSFYVDLELMVSRPRPRVEFDGVGVELSWSRSDVRKSGNA